MDVTDEFLKLADCNRSTIQNPKSKIQNGISSFNTTVDVSQYKIHRIAKSDGASVTGSVLLWPISGAETVLMIDYHNVMVVSVSLPRLKNIEQHPIRSRIALHLRVG
jgi:hypothetical protein